VSNNTLIHRIVRPAVRAVADKGVTPNHITTLRLLTGIAAALGFACGGMLWPAIGGVVFVFSMLLDRADGELARQTGQSSPFGHRYDVVSDCAANALALIGVGIGQVAALGLLAPVLGVIAGSGVAVLFWQFQGLALAEVPSLSLRKGRIVVDADDAAILLPVLVWCGAAVPMLVAAAIITPVAALWLGLQGARARRSG
jgi:phosphatidylglycerophosphate synthase